MSDIYTSFGRTLRELAEEEDPRKRADLHHRLAAQLELAFNAQANNVQGALGNAELGWHDRLDEMMGVIKSMENVGKDTHQLVQGVSSDLQQQGAAVSELRSEFRTLAESVSGIQADVDELKQGLEDSRRDRGIIHRELTKAEEEREKLSAQLGVLSDDFTQFKAMIQSLIDASPTPEETQVYISMIERDHADMQEVRALLTAAAEAKRDVRTE